MKYSLLNHASGKLEILEQSATKISQKLSRQRIRTTTRLFLLKNLGQRPIDPFRVKVETQLSDDEAASRLEKPSVR